MFFDSIGFGEMAVVALFALLVFGPEKLPEFLQGLGRAIRSFKKAVQDVEDEIKESIDIEAKKQNSKKENKEG